LTIDRITGKFDKGSCYSIETTILHAKIDSNRLNLSWISWKMKFTI